MAACAPYESIKVCRARHSKPVEMFRTRGAPKTERKVLSSRSSSSSSSSSAVMKSSTATAACPACSHSPPAATQHVETHRVQRVSGESERMRPGVSSVAVSAEQ